MLPALALAFYCSYSYSEQIFGQTPNVAQNALSWSMSHLPAQAGLTVSDVIYRYRAVKDPASNMLVHVQNEDALGDGYVFRDTEDWSGHAGNTFRKLVPVPDIPIQRWGQGSIEVEGEGSVEDAVVLYNWKYDTCFDPQSDPNCPGYKPPVPEETIDIMEYVKDPLEDEYIQQELERETPSETEEEEEERKRFQEKLEQLDRVEKLLGGINTALVNADAKLRHDQLMALSTLPVVYYKVLEGRSYGDTLQYPEQTVPDNRRGLRVGLAQELLHQEMVESQYSN